MIKRAFDLSFSIIGLILLSPLLIFIALVIKISSPGPIIYKGKRVGLHKKPFLMYKFRTMVVNADILGGPTTSEDDGRITPAGKILRRYKLDELPQLFNVLKGEMSFVGPRPEVEEVVKDFTKEQEILFSVRPGITDFASLRFMDEAKIVKGSLDAHKAYLEKILPEKTKLQMKYVKERSFWTDMKIILNTIKALLGSSKTKNVKQKSKHF